MNRYDETRQMVYESFHAGLIDEDEKDGLLEFLVESTGNTITCENGSIKKRNRIKDELI